MIKDFFWFAVTITVLAVIATLCAKAWLWMFAFWATL